MGYVSERMSLGWGGVGAMRTGRRREGLFWCGAVLVITMLVFVPAKAVSHVSTQTDGDVTQATGDAVGDVTQATGDATQTVDGAIGAGTTSSDGAAGDTSSGWEASATAHQGVEPGATTEGPTRLGIRRLATSADAESDVLTVQGDSGGIEEQGDPCDENRSLVCLGLLYGLGGFEEGGAKVLGILVTTGAAVIGLMIVSLGLGLMGSALVAVSRRFATRPAD
jgi:hypothetical protein